MKKALFIQLLDKYLDGRATAEEEALLQYYYHKLEAHSPFHLSEDQRESLRKLMLKEIKAQVNLREPALRNEKAGASGGALFSLGGIWKWAAAIVFFVLAGGLFFVWNRHSGVSEIAKNSYDVAPGSNKAVLTSSDGKVYALDSNGAMGLSSQIARVKDGTLIYQPREKQQESADRGNAAIEMNTLTVPRGGQFHLKLPDGTKIWLNSNSSLSYPTFFSGENRRVTLAGEGYFEVARDIHHPFIVQTTLSEITVLGTHFDVMAYPGKSITKAVLVEGAVKVTRLGGPGIIIHPGQQASVVRGSEQIKVQSVNTDAVTAWTRGFLYLHKSDVEDFMNQLSNWFDIDIEYQGAVPKGSFGGLINRNANLSDVLNALRINGIHTRLEAQKIIVLPE